MRLDVLLYVFFLNLAAVAMPALAADAQREWLLVRDRDGIQVYRAHNEKSRLKSFKSVTRFELDNIHAFVGVLKDQAAYAKWVHMISAAEIRNVAANGDFDLYVETRLPWPVDDRSAQMAARFMQYDDLTIVLQLEKSENEPPKKRGYVLAPESFGHIQLRPIQGSKEVEVEAEIFVDPGGYVPAFLVNLITDDMSFYTLKKLRKYILNDQYSDIRDGSIRGRPWLDGEHSSRP